MKIPFGGQKVPMVADGSGNKLALKIQLQIQAGLVACVAATASGIV